MADPAADIFVTGGGLDALALAVAQQQQQQQQQQAAAASTSAASSNGAPVAPPGLAHGSTGLAQSQASSSGAIGDANGQVSSRQAAFKVEAVVGQAPSPSSAGHQLPPFGVAGPGPASQPPTGGPSDASSASLANKGGEEVPIPAELLEWDDTLTTAERVKLARRAAHPDGPSSSPQAKKATEPVATGKPPAKKKKQKPKTTVGAVAAVAAGSSTKAKAKAKATPGGEAPASSAPAAAAAEVATAAAGAAAPPPSESLDNAELATAEADTTSKKNGDRGKFKGLGRAWRKGLSISGEKLKTMSRAEIEAAVQGWVPPVPGVSDAGASGSELGPAADNVASAGASSGKKPISAASSSSKPKSSTSATAADGKKKSSAKSATIVAGSSSSSIPAKRKATSASKDEGKSKKSSRSSAKKTALSTNASLSRGRNSSSPGPASGRSRSATADRHGSFSVEPSSAPAKTKDEEDDEEEEDDALYCLCQEKYDEDRIMLACDMCEQWYHPTCVGLPEDRIELVGQFICPRCVEMTDERTTWKTKCQTEGCFKSAVAGLTKYCSTTCGETHLVRLLDNAGLPRRHLEASTADAQPPSGACISNADFPGGLPFPLPAPDEPRRRLSDRAAELQRSIEAVEGHLGLLAKRLMLLSLATRRADLVQLDSNGALIFTDIPGQEVAAAAPVPVVPAAPSEPAQAPEPYNPKKKKSKFDSGPASNRVCGFDERLVLGEVEWTAWVRSDEGRATVGPLELELEPGTTPTPTVGGEGGPSPQAVRAYMADSPDDVWCNTSRKRCDAHSAWHKIRLDDFMLERSAKRLELGGLRDSLTAAQKELGLVDRRAQKRRQQREGGPMRDEAAESAPAQEAEPMAVDVKAALPADERLATEDVAMADDEPSEPTADVKAEASDAAEESKPTVETPLEPSPSIGRPRSPNPPPPRPAPPSAATDRAATTAAGGEEPAPPEAEADAGDAHMLEPTGPREEAPAAVAALDSTLPPSVAQGPPADPAPDAVAVSVT